MRIRILIGLLFGSLLGCIAHSEFTPSGSAALKPKPDSCSFDVLTTQPDRAFDTLGIVDVGSAVLHGGYGTGRPRTAAEFKDLVGSSVCKAGGDAVLAEVNGIGEYVRGTVIRYRQPAPNATTSSN